MTPPDRNLGQGRVAVYRHPVLVRITHWLNALCLLVLMGPLILALALLVKLK